jgi:succinoglycan biosynthesis protein ExoM
MKASFFAGRGIIQNQVTHQGGRVAIKSYNSDLLSAPADLPENSANRLTTEHISVCICTYKRPQLLNRLLQDLARQETDGLFTYSIVVVDNDKLSSAEAVALEFCNSSSISLTYCVVPEQNISMTRNKAIESSRGDFVAFIDDDEFPVQRWLVNLYSARKQYGVDGVLGPVKRHFDVTPPKWVLDSNFYDRKTYPTGTRVNYKEGRTGNVLLKRSIFEDIVPAFRPEFRGGEDTDFFTRSTKKGYKFVWCDEAIAYETVPPIRWNKKFLLRRALLRGATTLNYPDFGFKEIAKSAIAVPLYTLGLPFALMLGQHKFMELLVKLCDHLGKLLAVLRINPIKEHYITE